MGDGSTQYLNNFKAIRELKMKKIKQIEIISWLSMYVYVKIYINSYYQYIFAK